VGAKLGFVVNNLGPSQLAYNLLTKANALLSQRYDLDLIVFYEQPARPCVIPNFSIMPLSETWGYDGPLVATDLSSAATLINLPNPGRKIFYVYDLEWTFEPKRPYRALQAIYGHPELTILCRGEDHKGAIEDSWNVWATALGEIDPTTILEFLGGK